MAVADSSFARRAGIVRFLREFADARPGLRSGAMFGMPAVYAGQRLVAFVARDGLICRLGVGEVTKARGIRARPLVMKGRASRGWTRIHPRSPRDLREVAVLLELATANALGTKSWQSRRP